MDNYRASDDGDVGERVAKIVNEDTAQIEVAPAADEGEGDSAIHGEGGNGSPNHPAFYYFHGGAEALDGFVAKPERKQDKDGGVGVGGESAGAVIAVSLFAIGGALGPTHSEIGNAERRDVGKIVNSVVQKGDAASQDAAKDFRYHQPEGGRHGPAKHRRGQGRVRMAGVTVVVGMTGMTVVIFMRMCSHRLYSTRSTAGMQPVQCLLRTMTLCLRE